MKKILSSILAVLLIFYVLPTNLFGITVSAATTEFAGGSGTESDPYLIATKEHLNNVRNYPDAHYKMIADVVFSEEDFANGGLFYNSARGWKPIGTDDNSFSGVFDGNGHFIKNLYIKNVGGEFVGLFGHNEGIIQNLGLINADIYARGQVGGFIKSTDVYVGIIAGYSNGSILNCFSLGSVRGEAENAGSISTSNYKAYIYTGGIVGYIGNSGTVTNCYNNSFVSAYNPLQPNPYTGGIAGGASGTITTSYNTGNISSGTKCGIVGYLNTLGNSNITNCYYLDNVSKGVGSGTDVCIKCTAENMTKEETFVGFDFEAVWELSESNDYKYPTLKSFKKQGDTNGDFVINNKDCALLIQYTNGWDVQIDVAAADVNADGKINNKDYVLLMRYINGWDVELK